MHMGVIFGLLTLVTGSIWAKISWGEWWTWGERQLVLFLILFLFYSSYFMLRYSTEAGPRRERNSAVYALFGVVLIPVSFLAVRIAGTILHPTVFTHEGANLPWQMLVCFLICLGGMLALAATLYRVELAGKRSEREPARAAGAARMTTAEKYVTGAYLVLLGMLLVYLLIIALKVSRLEEELADLTRAAREKLGG